MRRAAVKALSLNADANADIRFAGYRMYEAAHSAKFSA
jgi:hypothetical protein